MRARASVPAIAAMLSLTTAAQDPQRPPVFRAGITLVEVEVAVLDAARRPVRGLSAADFTILEDGAPQEIQSFAAVELPAPPATRWMREIATDVRSNRAREGRLLALVLDDAQARHDMIPRAKQAAHRVLDGLSPGDLATVIFTRDNSRSQEFTEDRALLHKAVEQLHEGFTLRTEAPPPQAAVTGSRAKPLVVTPDSGDRLQETFYLYSLNVLGRVANALASVPKRRKAIVYVSAGVPVWPSPLNPLRTAQTEAILQAKRSNVTVYSIDPSANPYLVRNSLQQQSLAALSEETGGFVTGDRDDLARGVAQLLEETGSYYLLGYQSPRMEADGKLRSVAVKVARPDVLVQARAGYYPRSSARGTREEPKPEVAGAMMSSDVEMRLLAAPFAGGGGRASLALMLGVRQPAPANGASLKESLTLEMAAYATEGRLKASRRETYDFRLNAAGDVVSYDVFSQLDVEPGTYQLRVASTSAAQGKTGSVYYEVEVPDFSKRPLSLSGLVLATDPAAPAIGKDQLAAFLPVSPTTRRVFNRQDRVTAFVRVYRSKKSVAPVDLVAKIEDARGQGVFEVTETLAADRFRTGQATDYRLELPMARLAAGHHLLTVEARLSEKDFDRRVLRFEKIP